MCNFKVKKYFYIKYTNQTNLKNFQNVELIVVELIFTTLLNIPIIQFSEYIREIDHNDVSANTYE